MITYGIEELRAMAQYFDWCNETNNQQFTVEELYAILKCVQKHPDWDEFYDTWTDDQLDEALKGT